ncbi:MAG: HAD-IA family hydrolase [Ferruginibacter sp.]
MSGNKITTMFLDIGGVLLTNGWDRSARALAAKQFNIDLPEMDERHHLCFDSYERGRMTMDEYLKKVVFYEERDFTKDTFKDFICSRSEALPGHIEFFKSIKEKYKIKVVAVNNEAKEINEYRISKFKLHELFDAFISSCYVGLRKPDNDIFRLAIDLAQTLPQNAIFVDDRKMFVEVAEEVGLNAIQFTGLDTIEEKLKKFLHK